ncbi:hypothetical protein XBFM1_2560010 [Xenorhabdus bovienii str. feltiae Moldova]|uniref:Uncharacterized protein n=1 Tax=Xenorhabdus bovienii str. feltiae Moldova TaxID=1398200 RepID=A0A077NTR2_XENBV|nr:hypothetical protein XBFM1_2560010 [Xenorhabdus bovienii str. feltiae Moldova]
MHAQMCRNNKARPQERKKTIKFASSVRRINLNKVMDEVVMTPKRYNDIFQYMSQ